jgi:hypothetical protein
VCSFHQVDNNDDGKGTMEALYFGTSGGWGHGEGKGPWIMADLENGLWAGANRSAPAPSITFQYVTAMAKGRKGGFALKGTALHLHFQRCRFVIQAHVQGLIQVCMPARRRERAGRCLDDTA